MNEIQERKPRRRGRSPLGGSASHPLLGDRPTLALMRANEEPRGDEEDDNAQWWNPFARPPVSTSIPMNLEPKTFLASERTFLSWLHMAITLASISAALLAFASTSHKIRDPMHLVG